MQKLKPNMKTMPTLTPLLITRNQNSQTLKQTQQLIKQLVRLNLLMSQTQTPMLSLTAEKTKLAGVEEGAEVNETKPELLTTLGTLSESEQTGLGISIRLEAAGSVNL